MAIVSDRVSDSSQEPPSESRVSLRSTSRRCWPTGRIAIGLLILESVFITSRMHQWLGRPLWYDEQWRAYHATSGRGFWASLPNAEAPMTAGWVAVERLSVWVFGNVEWALRLPMVLSLPLLGYLTFRLALEFLGVLASFVVAAAVTMNPWFAEYAFQLKPFTFEAAVSVLAILLWIRSRVRDDRAHPVLTYSLLGLCTLFATSAVLVVGAAFCLDAGRAARRRHWRIFPAMVPGLAIVLAHLGLFVTRQSTLSRGNGWDANFVPRTSLGDVARFLMRQAKSFVPEVFARDLKVSGQASHGVGLTLTILMIVLLIAGLATAAIRHRERQLLMLLIVTFALQFLAAALRRWPFGFERVNLFLLPPLYILAAIGLVHGARGLAGSARADQASVPRASTIGVGRRAAGLLGLLSLIAVSLTGLADLWRIEAASQRGLHKLSLGLAFGDGLRTFVYDTRYQAGAADLAIVAGGQDFEVVTGQSMATKGWSYYMWQYEGMPWEVHHLPALPESRTRFLVDQPDPAATAAWVRANPGAQHVFLMVYVNEPPRYAASLQSAVTHEGYRVTATKRYPWTGQLLTLTRVPRAAPRHRDARG